MLTTSPPNVAIPPPSPSLEGDTHHVRCSIPTRAPVEAVWSLWLDVEGWPRWDDQLEWARLEEVGGQIRVGASGLLKSRGSPPSRFEIVRFDETGYAFTTRLPAGLLRVTRELARSESGWLVTHDVRFEGVGGWCLGWILGPRFRRALPGVLTALVVLAEGPRS